MRITKRQLRRIIKESIWDISHDEAVTYLTDRANSYHEDAKTDDRLTPDAIKTLLLDDFVDDLGQDFYIEDYKKLIDQLAFGSGAGLGL